MEGRTCPTCACLLHSFDSGLRCPICNFEVAHNVLNRIDELTVKLIDEMVREQLALMRQEAVKTSPIFDRIRGLLVEIGQAQESVLTFRRRHGTRGGACVVYCC